MIDSFNLMFINLKKFKKIEYLIDKQSNRCKQSEIV